MAPWNDADGLNEKTAKKILDLTYNAINIDQVILLEAELLKDVLSSPTLRTTSPQLMEDAIGRLDKMIKDVQVSWECLRSIMNLVKPK